MPDRQKEDIAKLWAFKVPGDPEPLLLLMTLAESRNALKLALTNLARAEAINPLNPMVRRARLRLTMATAWRHFKDRKPHLVEKDLADLEAHVGHAGGRPPRRAVGDAGGVARPAADDPPPPRRRATRW